jgi:malonate-semialdehyde dehydrogenase (acetylating)/methylmalonate-semialdehyde dehydrogenase
MGNCVILKPSEKVPMTMMRMTELLVEAGMPKGVFQIVHGMADIVTAMCDHPDISAVTFVGSSKVAEIVANRCNAVHKRVSLVPRLYVSHANIHFFPFQKVSDFN